MQNAKSFAYSIALAVACATIGHHPATAATQPSNQTGSASDKNDLFIKCSTVINGARYIPKERFEALADNLADSDFAEFDPKCLGKKRNPAGVAQAAKKKTRAAQRFAHDMQDVDEQRSAIPGTNRVGVPADVLRKDFGKEKTSAPPFLFRDAYSAYSLLNPPPPKEKATGTQISYTQDYYNHNTVLSGVGAVIGWNVLSDAANPFASLGVTRTLLAPGFEFDEVRNQADRTKNMDYLGFRVISEIEKETDGGLFPLQYFRASPYWKTDSHGASRIAGAYVEWEPYRLEWAIGVARRLGDTPIQFRWSPVFHVEAERVIDAGALANVHSGDHYFRGGPILEGDIFFADGPLQPFVLTAQYRYLWNASNSGTGYDIRYLQTSLAYNLTPDGNAALSVTYRDGNAPSNNTRVRDLKTGLTIKF
jgi:hypothetical protein